MGAREEGGQENNGAEQEEQEEQEEEGKECGESTEQTDIGVDFECNVMRQRTN